MSLEREARVSWWIEGMHGNHVQKELLKKSENEWVMEWSKLAI
jgi:hypothetical protein